MIRQAFAKNYVSKENGFRYRGEQPGRLENFSDAVFALAITLLLISTSAPANFLQVKRFVYEIIPFIFSISLIILIWHEHFQFFIRYGLRNGKIIALNTFFLVIVLFYVYPLKFLTRLILIPIGILLDKKWLVDEMMGIIHPEDMGDLMIIYGLGAASVFFVLSLMYRSALAAAPELELTTLEIFETRSSIVSNIFMGIIPLISVLVAFIFRQSHLSGMLAGFCYALYTPVMMMYGKRVKRNKEKLIASLLPPSTEPEKNSPA